MNESENEEISSESESEETPSDEQLNAQIDSHNEIPSSSSQIDRNEREFNSPLHDQNPPLKRS